MIANAIIQVGIFCALVTAISVPLGLYMARVFAGEPTMLDPVLKPIERTIYRVCGIHPEAEETWVEYAVSMLLFSMVGMLVLYAMERLQYYLPLNPQQFGAVAPDLAFNTAASFTTNTNWQAYGGESTMSYFTQMAGIAFHNFVSAAAGISVAIAVIRGFVRRSAQTIGNFWFDMTRATLWVLLPISVIGALVLVWQGVPQNFSPYTHVKTVEGADQVIAQGPVASQEVIKELGTNGGGFFNANSAHPFENPNAWTNLLETWSLLLIPVASVLAFGRAVGDMRQGRAILATMGVFLLVGVAIVYWSETSGNPILTALGVDPSAGNLEGKEIRFGQALSALFTVGTTGTGTGAVVTMHDSLTPLGGLVPMFDILAGCIWPGGVGAGLYGFLVVAIIAVFVAGLMVRRTPEYLGKKIESREMKLAMFAVLIYPMVVLGFSAASVLLKTALDSLNNSGPHGLSEIIYAFASTNANNGSG